MIKEVKLSKTCFSDKNRIQTINQLSIIFKPTQGANQYKVDNYIIGLAYI